MWPMAPSEVTPHSCQVACDCPGLYLSGIIPNLISTISAQASRVTKVAAQQLSSTLTALRAEVAHGGAEIADGVGALLGKPVAARPRSPSPASKRDAAAPPPLVQALLAEPDGAQDFEAWAREHAEFPSDRISAAREADSALAFAYVCVGGGCA